MASRDQETWTRRDAVARGAPERDRFRTALCDLLGIDYAVLQAPMGGVATPEMVAAVGEAGGLGILPGVGVAPEELRGQIRRVRELTRRPFGVNLLLHPDIHHPADPAEIPDDAVVRVQDTLNRFRARLGLAPVSARPPRAPSIANAAFEVVLEERVPVFSVGLGRLAPEWVARCRERGTKVLAMATTAADAAELASLGADAVVAQGAEAGGHRSTWVKRPSGEHAGIGTLALVPQVADAVQVPVVAAGGIVDGRQLAAALLLGAAGVLMGTRFIATRESAAPEFYQRALLDAESDATTVTDAFSGLWARALRTPFTEEYRASGAPVFPPILQQLALDDLKRASQAAGTGDFYPLYAGQGAGMVRDTLTAAEVVATVVREAREALSALPSLVETS